MKRGITVLIVLAAVLMLLCAAACAEEPAYRPQDLPVIYLQIDGGEEEISRMNESWDHSYKCAGTMDIIVPDGYDGQLEGRYPQESVRGLRMKYIRGRGNGTWGFSKHPYKIKLEEKQDLFGLGKSRTWVLIANYLDNSMIRNQLTAWLGEQMGLEYTPRGVFTEVVMNGEYLGCYWFAEQVQVSKSRVAIDQLAETDTELPAVQGGYLLEFNPDDEGPDTFETAHGQMLGNQDPSFDTENGGWENDAQMNYIRDYIQRAEDAVFAEDGQDYAEYLDLRSLADYWWIQEFTVNGDAFRTDSAHMYKKRYEADGSEGKLYFGPLWDFDESWGNAQIETTQNIGFNNSTMIWADELRKKPEFRTLLEERWRMMDAKLEEIVREGGILDRIAGVIQGAWERDRLKWQDAMAENGLGERGFREEIEHIREWTDLRREWINGHMDRLGILTFRLTVRGDGLEEKTYTEACDSCIDTYMLEDGIEDEREIAGWQFEDGTPVGDFFVMDRDITLTVLFEEGK